MTGRARKPARAVRLRVFGHPLHASLVHLPMGLLASVAVWDLCGLLLEDPTWWSVSFWSLALGTAAALPALATGLLDYVGLPEGSPAEGTARRHMFAALGVVACYGTSLALRSTSDPLFAGGGSAVAASYLGLGFLALLGWLGGELVLRHGVGSVPAVEAEPRE